MMDEGEPEAILSSASSWDIATRYHEFKGKALLRKSLASLRKLSVGAILDRAKAILGSVAHPMEQRVCPWVELPPDAQQVDIDLEETLDQSPDLRPEEIWMSYLTPRKQTLILSVDTSLSMTGDKLALTAVALAVVLLQFPEDPIGIIAFENRPQVLKRPDERISIEELIERFLDVPAQGYTHLEYGMKAALDMVKAYPQARQARPASVVLVTDGKYTAGRDPAYIAQRFSHLVVMKMGRERSSLELCHELARRGRGTLKEVAELDSLPTVMYSVVKDLLRRTS